MDLIKIEKYIRDLQTNEENFKNQSLISSPETTMGNETGLGYLFRSAIFVIQSVGDYLLLIFLLKFQKTSHKNKRIVFTAKNFCTETGGCLEDRVVRPLFTENIIFINQSKVIRLNKINDQKVYNLGGLVKLISRLRYKKQSSLMRLFCAYRSVNDSIIRLVYGMELYMLWFYDLNSLALAFSKHRENIRLIEVQHGSIINYPPYIEPAPVRIADVFYVKNSATVEFLSNHLCLNHNSEYRLMPYPESQKKYLPGLHILYASTVEFNGFHPVFKEFLKKNSYKELHLIVRLHPREREKETMFSDELSACGINYEFDHSKNWLEGNGIKNLIVISPWSSTLEDAYDNGYLAITVDVVGKERFKHLIDNTRFYYSDDLSYTLQCIQAKKIKE